jgi:hypothetical protein
MISETSVDGDIIAAVAREYNMGAGGLKGLLKSSHLEEYNENSREMKAIREAYARQRERDNV